MYVNAWWEAGKELQPGCSQWRPVPGPEAMGANQNTRKFILCKETLYYIEGGQILAQAAQRGCGVSILGDTQGNWTLSWTTALGDPACTEGRTR